MTDKNFAQEWKSFEERTNAGNVPAATLNEFQNPQMLQEPGDSARREFLKIMGAGAALTGFAGCARPVEKIIPEVNRPAQFTPGAKVHYASVCQGCADACGVVVKTVDGRPIKLEGRRASLVGRGALCASAQASTYDLFDPERLQISQVGGGQLAISELDTALLSVFQLAKTVRWIRPSYPSPIYDKTLAGFLGSFQDGKDVVYDAIGHEAALRANELLYGKKTLPRVRLDKADRILDLGSDFLNLAYGRLDLAKDLASRRGLEDGKEPVRLTTVEGVLSHTGTNADDRIVVRQSLVEDIGLAVAREIAQATTGVDPKILTALAPYSISGVAATAGVKPDKLQALAKDLLANKGKVVAFGAPTLRGQLTAAILNALVGAEGAILDGAGITSLQGRSSEFELTGLIAEMNSGKVDILVIDGLNPVYTLPKSSGFREALAKVRTVVSLSLHLDETAALATFVQPKTHWLEDWNVAEPLAGVFQLAQPTIAPLYKEVRGTLDTLLAWTKALGKTSPWNATTSYDAVRGYWAELQTSAGVTGKFELFWEDSLRNGGFVPSASKKAVSSAAARSLSVGDLAILGAPKNPQGLELAPYWPSGMRDGSQGNNPHIQELPDPVTKMTWGNAALIGPSQASALGVKTEDMLEVKANGASYPLSTYVVPGMHKDVVAVALGYGRTANLRLLHRRKEGLLIDLAYATDGVGMDQVPETIGLDIGSSGAFGTGSSALDVRSAEVVVMGKPGRLATTQHHHDIAHQEKPGDSDWRQIAVQVNWEEIKKDPKVGSPDIHSELFTIWGDPEYKALQKWGMAIDMNRCNGCSACVVACHVENNVPMVGFEEVRRGRDMHWLRIDRYYHGNLEEPQTTHQPMLCQQCDNAPCETVCPVVATTHSDDGLNQMTYNRCIGTRYCANNCPYKVRRFNWTNNWKANGLVNLYEKTDDGRTPNAPLAMAFNPEVTIRYRGVMEKCTFCVQRIQNGRYDAKELGLDRIPDGDVKTACQQSCPAEAIVFGDIKDPTSKVSKLIQAERGYKVLEWLQVKPNVTFLPRVRHTADKDAVSTAVAFKAKAKSENAGEHGDHVEAHGANNEHL